jgi:hypothetical protein
MSAVPKSGRWIIAAIAALILWAAITTAIAHQFHISYRAAGALLFLPLIPPALGWAAWSKWRERRRHRAQVRDAVHGPRIVDSSHVSGLDRGSAEVD